MRKKFELSESDYQALMKAKTLPAARAWWSAFCEREGYSRATVRSLGKRCFSAELTASKGAQA